MQIWISFTSNMDITLPIHYNHIVQAFIYNNIDEELANILHNKGFTSNNRTFRLFSFSRILNRGRKEGRYFNFNKRIELVVSSPLDEFCKSIANYMLQREDLYLGRNKIKTKEIQILNDPVKKDEIKIRTLSPIVAYSTLLRPDGRKYTCYFMPQEPDFNRIVIENLRKKYTALNNVDLAINNQLEIIPIGSLKQNIVYYKNIVIKGASGKFLIKGDKRLLQIGLDTGFGSKNSQGFGCVKII